MKKMSETIIFFGSGPVAADSLRQLAKNFKIEAVITKPRAATHKGTVPVFESAQQLHLRVFTVGDRLSLDKLVAKTKFTSNIGVLVDFGIIVSHKVIEAFPFGIINSHFSLLPQWRGADPITFAILSGQVETGVSLMVLVEKMDEGPILAYAPLKLSGYETTPELTAKLIELSNILLKEIVPQYIAGRLQPQPQNTSTKPTYSRKLTKADGIIDWHKPAVQLEREIRAFAGWPKSRTQLADKDITITKAHISSGVGSPGTIWKNGKNFGIYTQQDILVIDSLKPAGKIEMSAEAFLAGYGKKL